MAMNMAIEFINVSKKFGKKTVLKELNFVIPTGNVIGLQGINGSGKTMIMRLIAGLIYPTTGDVLIDKKRLGKDISFPESLGLMLENPAFLDSYSGFENLKLLASLNKKITDKEIFEVLTLVGLSDNADKKYKKYSLGMKQRLGIAAAIMEKPDIILLDEPTNSLDEDGIRMVREIVFKEKERGATVVLSCHDATILKQLSDSVLCIENGEIVDNYICKKEV